MFGFLLLLALGAMIIPVILIATVFKIAFKLVLLPFKLLLLPFILVAVIVKFAILLALGAVVVALIIPFLILLALIAVPFVIAAAVS